MDIVEINAETGEVVEREFSDDEKNQRQLDIEEFMKIQQQNIKRENARASALAKIAEIAGLTEEEVNAL